MVHKINLHCNYRPQAIKACHDDNGHLGLQRCLDFLKDRFYWPGMNDEMENCIWNCERCLHFKRKVQKTELCPITAAHLLELIHMDFLTIESGMIDTDETILVITNHFT